MYTGWADTPGVQSSMPGFYERTKNMLRNDYEGSDTIVWLACCTKPAVQEASGKFYFDREEAEYVCWRLLEPPRTIVVAHHDHAQVPPHRSLHAVPSRGRGTPLGRVLSPVRLAAGHRRRSKHKHKHKHKQQQQQRSSGRGGCRAVEESAAPQW